MLNAGVQILKSADYEFKLAMCHYLYLWHSGTVSLMLSNKINEYEK